MRAIAALAAAFLFATPAWAHHAFAAEFDIKKPVKLQGTVTKMEWINPHAWIHIDVKGPDGKITSWMVEGGTPNILLRRGFTKQARGLQCRARSSPRRRAVDGAARTYRWLPGQGRFLSRQRLEHYLHRRQTVVPGRIES